VPRQGCSRGAARRVDVEAAPPLPGSGARRERVGAGGVPVGRQHEADLPGRCAAAQAAPLSKARCRRVIGTLRGELATREKRSLAELDVAFLYSTRFALRVRMDRRVTSVPVLVALRSSPAARKQLVAMEMCGSESHEAWKGFLDGLVERGLRAPVLCIVDGNAGLAASALDDLEQDASAALRGAQAAATSSGRHRSTRLSEMKVDFTRFVYAESEAAARRAHADFVSKWKGAARA